MNKHEGPTAVASIISKRSTIPLKRATTLIVIATTTAMIWGCQSKQLSVPAAAKVSRADCADIADDMIGWDSLVFHGDSQVTVSTGFPVDEPAMAVGPNFGLDGYLHGLTLAPEKWVCQNCPDPYMPCDMYITINAPDTSYIETRQIVPFDGPIWEDDYFEVITDEGTVAIGWEDYGIIYEQPALFRTLGSTVQVHIHLGMADHSQSFYMMAFMVGVDETTSAAYYDARKTESIIGNDDIENIDAATDGQKDLAKNVALVKFDVGVTMRKFDTDGTLLETKNVVSAATCSGSLTGENQKIFSTNHHCLPLATEAWDKNEPDGKRWVGSQVNASAASQYKFWFNYKGADKKAAEAAATKVERAGTSMPLLRENGGALDYGLFELNGGPTTTIHVDANGAVANQQIFIIGHPAGRPLSITRKDDQLGGNPCKIDRIDGTDAKYSCDTLGGSSGSPVISVTGNKSVALHHLGTSDPLTNPFNSGANWSNILAQPGVRARLGM